jgi:beta-glucanase (GH16 family)
MLITDRYSSFAHTLSRVVFATTLALGCAACATAGSETAAETDATSGASEAAALSGSGPITPQLNTQLCLDVSGGSQTNGTLVQISRCSGDAAQKWTYTNNTLRVFDNKCLSVVGGQDSDGTKLQIWDCVANDPAESFTFTNNQFQWTNKTRCIDIPYGQATDGMQMQIVTCGASNAAQKWNMQTTASTTTTSTASTYSGPITPQLNTQLCLDVSGGSQTNGTLVQIASCSGNPAQKWTYTNNSLRVFSNKCLSVVGGQDADGTKLQIWDCVANDPAESFTFTNNEFQWTNKTRCIDIPYGQATDGTQMQIVTCGANNSAQKWNMATTASTTTTTTTTTTSAAGKYTNLVWSDDFHAMTAIDTSKWNVEVTCAPNNNELECYTASQSNVVGDGAGNLLIKVAKVSGLANGRSYTSGRINTQNKGDWTYGRFEMRAKMPKGQGFWPAFWMMPTTSAYGAWPTSGELDITEVLGSTITTSYGTAHYGLPSPYTQSQGVYNGADLSSAFHIYALERDAHQVRWYLDGVLFYTLNDTDKSFWPAGYTPSDGTPWPFTQKFYIIINLAMGGDWPGAPDPSITSGEMVIDYVRVYQ